MEDVISATALGRKTSSNISVADMEGMLEKWVRFHGFALMGATIHALQLAHDIRRSHTHIVRMRISTKEDASSSKPEIAFTIRIFHPLEQSTARTMGHLWNESLDKLAAMRTESEQAGRGTVAAVFIECKPLGLHVMPFGSLKDLDDMRDVGDNWLDILIRAVDQGRRIKRFEDRECKPLAEKESK